MFSFILSCIIIAFYTDKTPITNDLINFAWCCLVLDIILAIRILLLAYYRNLTKSDLINVPLIILGIVQVAMLIDSKTGFVSMDSFNVAVSYLSVMGVIALVYIYFVYYAVATISRIGYRSSGAYNPAYY